MTPSISQADHEAVLAVLRALETAWNSGDGEGFGAPMSEDADFVTVRAEHLKGRAAIVASHAHIFSQIYAGSRNAISLEAARTLAVDVTLVHAKAVLEAPAGPLAGRHEARMTLVLQRSDPDWLISAFHITLAG